MQEYLVGIPLNPKPCESKLLSKLDKPIGSDDIEFPTNQRERSIQGSLFIFLDAIASLLLAGLYVCTVG